MYIYIHGSLKSDWGRVYACTLHVNTNIRYLLAQDVPLFLGICFSMGFLFTQAFRPFSLPHHPLPPGRPSHPLPLYRGSTQRNSIEFCIASPIKKVLIHFWRFFFAWLTIIKPAIVYKGKGNEQRWRCCGEISFTKFQDPSVWQKFKKKKKNKRQKKKWYVTQWGIF